MNQDMQDLLARQGHFGWIPPARRTQQQQDAHVAAMAAMPKFQVVGHIDPTEPVKVVLTDLWKDPLVIADVGFEFTGFRQLTGSCVGVSAGDAMFTLAAVQRKFATNPTKAFCPFWPYAYGRTRYNEGDHGQGEGAVDSVMAATLKDEGTFGIQETSGLPTFDHSDGLAITSGQEYQWSDGGRIASNFIALGKTHLLGTAAPLSSTADIKAAILNGYPVLDGCDDYIGNGSLQGDVALGNYDGRGGHSTCYLGYWDHPQHGPIFLYSNQWSGNTYPQDGSGKGRCCVWVKEANVARLFSLGGSGGETVALSHENYFPAQPTVMRWFI